MMNDRMYGTVSLSVHPQSCYVRASIPSKTGGNPLSLKASFEGFDRDAFQKGDVVEVENVRGGYKGYKVLRMYKVDKDVGLVLIKPKKKSQPKSFFFFDGPIAWMRQHDGRYDTLVWDIETRKHYDYKKEWNDAMKKENVRFFLGGRYLRHNSVYPVLESAFGLLQGDAKVFWGKSRDDGFWITCRKDQFAMFMICRNKAVGLQNGFADLQAELVPSMPKNDPYTLLAERAGITRDQAKKVSLALCFSGNDELMSRVSKNQTEVDVSNN